MSLDEAGVGIGRGAHAETNGIQQIADTEFVMFSQSRRSSHRADELDATISRQILTGHSSSAISDQSKGRT